MDSHFFADPYPAVFFNAIPYEEFSVIEKKPKNLKTTELVLICLHFCEQNYIFSVVICNFCLLDPDPHSTALIC